MWASRQTAPAGQTSLRSATMGLRARHERLWRAVGTARMTRTMRLAHSISVGRYAHPPCRGSSCVRRRCGSGFTLRIEDGRFKVVTTRPLDYGEHEPQDPVLRPVLVRGGARGAGVQG
jgi:hypothetical protein